MALLRKITYQDDFAASIISLELAAFPKIFLALIWITMAVNVIFLIYGIVKLVSYIKRRRRYEEHMRNVRPRKEPISFVPWGTQDKQGTSMGGLALTGSF